MPSVTLDKPQWWHKAAIYQIYPSSYKDSNGDGFGDIPGIISKVSHIASLGVDAVWLSPCYKSPLVDMGYDISDYRQIDPRYGSVEDVEILIRELGKHNIKLLMDLVVNHTSDQHEWFKESRASKDSPKRDWYYWRKGSTEIKTDGTVIKLPPNNWESMFRGPAWTYDEGTDEWYLRLFASEQPDLNWENPAVRKAVHDDMRFWLDKGIGGFRMDVINFISKVDGLPTAPIVRPETHHQPAGQYFYNGPRVHEFLQEIQRGVLSHYPNTMTVGEVPGTDDPAVVRQFIEPGRKEINMLFQFDLVALDCDQGLFEGKFVPVPITPSRFKSTLTFWQKALSYSTGAWPTTFFENHDIARSVTRFGDRNPGNRFAVAKMLAVLLATVSGTIFLHHGQEIGIANYTEDIPISDYRDIETQNIRREMYNSLKKTTPEGQEPDMSSVDREIRIKARDHGRIPMPWSTGRNGGFSDAEEGKTWAPVNTDIEECNVAKQTADPGSVLSFWRKILAFRKARPQALVFGNFVQLDEVDEGPVYAFKKVPLEASEKTLLVLLNLGHGEVQWDIPAELQGSLTNLMSPLISAKEQGIDIKKTESGMAVALKPYDGFVFEL